MKRTRIYLSKTDYYASPVPRYDEKENLQQQSSKRERKRWRFIKVKLFSYASINSTIESEGWELGI